MLHLGLRGLGFRGFICKICTDCIEWRIREPGFYSVVRHTPLIIIGLRSCIDIGKRLTLVNNLLLTFAYKVFVI